jgi:diguanylate cyclase (GGDEF)-like protein/PAS domain S-box-containing protein
MSKRNPKKTFPLLRYASDRLRRRLSEVESTLYAIQHGQVDAIFTTNEKGSEVLTLEGASNVYRSLIEGMSEGIVTLDIEGNILYCNQRFSEIINTPVKQVLSTLFANWIVPTDLPNFLALQERSTNGVGRGEITLSNNKQMIPTQISITRLQLEGREAISCMVTDLTEQRLALLVLEQTTEAIVVCNDKGIIIRASGVAASLVSGEIIGQQFSVAFPLHLSDDSVLDIQAVLKGKRLRCEASFEHGALPLHFLVNAGPLSGKQADLLGAIITLTDISARKHTENILSLRNRALDASSEAVFIARCENDLHLIEYINPAFEKITGLSSKQAMEKDLLVVQEQIGNKQDLIKIQDALQKKRPGHAITHNTRLDGSKFWSDLHVAPVRDEHGNTTHFVGIQNDISESMSHQSILEYQANHDALTGLPNRHLLNTRLQQAISAAKRSPHLMALVFVDLDHFKFVNDTLGHDVGDIVLTTIAKRLTSCLRDADTAARSGGDEFLLILVDHESTESISAVIRRVLEVIAQPIIANEQNLYITCSIGISLFSQDGDNASTLLKNADTAMYHAKEKGRNNFQFFNNEMNFRVHERFMLESSLRQAMTDNSLSLAYQPQIDVLTGKVIGVEALLRWKHAELGNIPPTRFIPIAEESGLIVALGEWVLRTACTQAKTWQDSGMPAMTMAVNLSARQFKQNNLPHLVKTILTETGLAAKYLELELTESLAFENSEKLILTLTQLKAMGLQITIDDFGTGYSSLSYLKHLPLDRLKIDISFIHDIVIDKGDEAIAQIIILLGHSLRLKVIAEGVETNEQLKILLAQGCDEIQGFYYSEALCVKDLEKFLIAKKDINTLVSSH